MDDKERYMEIFDLTQLAAEGYENRSMNVFYQTTFLRHVSSYWNPAEPFLSVRWSPTSCFMWFVVQYCCKNGKSAALKEGQVFISEPALISMKTLTGTRLMGVQIRAQNVR